MLTSREIRGSFIEFFKQHGHTFVPSWPVVPIGDETLLFTNAGMNQFKDIFLGHSQPQWKRAANSQKCIRVSGKHNDLEEVGIDTYHHTFFEMLGNWSFGDYFKAESIEWAWKLLTEVYGIDSNQLWATVFGGDKQDRSAPDSEAAELWAKLTSLPKEKILACGRKDNFWEMGNTGPCGPCSEIHIDLGPDRCDMKHIPGHICKVNGGCSRFMELWNLVFIQFNRKTDGSLERLRANYVDTGAGLERFCSVLQKKTSNYDTDLFMPIISAAQDLTGKKYTSQLGNKTDNAFRVIADHIRTLTFAITDGVSPSNDGRGYVIRRLLRRAARFGRTLGVHEPFMYKLMPVVASEMGDAFPELKGRAEFVGQVIQSEETSFGRTLDRGLELFSVAADKAEKTSGKIISGDDAFQLYDTFGFPLDLTELMARERGLKVDTDVFMKLMDQQRERARAAQKSVSLTAGLSNVQLPATDDAAKYETMSCRAKVLGWVTQEGFVQEGSFEDTNKIAALVLDKTCFYAESGGQTGDIGHITGANWEFIVENTEKAGNCVLHKGRLHTGCLNVGDTAELAVSKDRRASMKNHTATHLLQWALQETLGNSVKQQGSAVCPEYLRFDFTWPKALSKEQLTQVQKLVNEKIAAAEPVAYVALPIEQAKKLGAMALFGEKYGDTVRVIAVGAPDKDHFNDAFSKEFCGGTHVSNTSEIGGFAVLKEESVSAGVRRITALTGTGLVEHLLTRNDIVDELVGALKVPADQVVIRVHKILEDNKSLAKQLKSGATAAAAAQISAADLLAKAQKIGGVSVIAEQIPPIGQDQARGLIDSLRAKAGSAVVVLAMAESDDKVMLFAGVTDDLIKKVSSGDIVKTIAPIVGGGGGGRPQFAQAGGKDASKIADALDAAKKFISDKLG
jgi:alanyl-tRNA synthetase